MPTKRKLHITLRPGEALRVSRVSAGRNKLVYVILADKKIRYLTGHSRVVYIGTTRRGVGRIASAAVTRAEDVFSVRGVRELSVRVITCQARRNIKTWIKLKHGLLLLFRETYGEVPYCNSPARRMRATDEFHYFSRGRLRGLLEEIE